MKFSNCRLVGSNLTCSSLNNTTVCDCNCRYSNMSSCSAKSTLFDSCDMTNSYMADMQLKSVAWDKCRLVEAEFLHTSLNGIDMRTNDISGMLLTGPELKGAIVTAQQACELSRLLGVIIK